MHTTQKALLKRLVLSGKQKYSALTRGFTYDDNILFHLNQLLKKNLVSKTTAGYRITKAGTQALYKFDFATLTDTGFWSFMCGLICSCGNRYLLKSHSQAINNFFNLPSGQPQLSETIDKALVRLLHQYTGFKAKPTDFNFLSLHLKTIKNTSGEIIFNDAFTVYKITVSPSHKAAMKLHSQVAWYSKEEIKTLPNRWPEIDLCILKKDRTPYRVYSFTSDYIL